MLRLQPIHGIFLSVFTLTLIAGFALWSIHRSNARWEHTYSDRVARATLSLNADGSMLVLAEANGTVSERPFASVETIEIFGNALDNLLTVDFSNGDPIPENGLFYHGLDEETPEGDALAMVGNEHVSTTYQPTELTSGVLEISGTGRRSGMLSLITFTGLEPVIDDISAANLTVNGTAGSNDITIGEASDTTRFMVTVDAFENIRAKNKTTLIINAGDGSDTITIDEPTGATGLTDIQVNGQVGDDTVNLVTVPVDLEVLSSEALEINGSSVGTATTQALDVQGLAMRFDMAGTVPGTEHDQIAATSVNLTGSTLTVDATFTPSGGDTFLIIDASAGVTGEFLSLSEGGLLPGGIGGQPATISYTGGDGDDVVLTIIEFQPDIRVGKRSDALTHRGNNEYGFNVASQNLLIRMRSNDKRGRFYFSVEDDSGSGSDLFLFARQNRRSVRLRYQQTNPAGGNVTASIVRGLLFADIVNPTDIISYRGTIISRSPRANDRISVRVQHVEDVRRLDRASILVKKR